MSKGRVPGRRSGPAKREGRETTKEAADLLTTKPAEPPAVHPPRMRREDALLADSESRRPAGQPGRGRGPSLGTAASCAVFTTAGCCLSAKVVIPQQLQAYMAAQQAAQSSSGSTQ